MGLWNDQTGLPTGKGLVNAAQQTGNALLMGTRAPSSLASRSGFLYNAPPKPPRPFEADYPTGAPADATGRLTADIEGRPLGAQFVAGRRAVGGSDEAIPPAEFDALAEAAIGRAPVAVASGEIRGDAGRFTRTAPPADSASGDAVYDIYTNRTLSEGGRTLATGHELGHMVDELVGQIDPKGLQPQLGRRRDVLLPLAHHPQIASHPIGSATLSVPIASSTQDSRQLDRFSHRELTASPV
jgi:hypothetical protein